MDIGKWPKFPSRAEIETPRPKVVTVKERKRITPSHVAAARTMKVGEVLEVPYPGRTVDYSWSMHKGSGFKFSQKKDGDIVRITRIS